MLETALCDFFKFGRERIDGANFVGEAGWPDVQLRGCLSSREAHNQFRSLRHFIGVIRDHSADIAGQKDRCPAGIGRWVYPSIDQKLGVF